LPPRAPHPDLRPLQRLKINALKDDSRATGSRWGGVQGYWIGEGDSLTPSRPKFRQMNLELKKLAGLLYATSEMLQDATALAGVISEAFPPSSPSCSTTRCSRAPAVRSRSAS
jgi:hypothetical protein